MPGMSRRPTRSSKCVGMKKKVMLNKKHAQCTHAYLVVYLINGR